MCWLQVVTVTVWIKAPLIGSEEEGFEDVTTATVVLETPVVQVHGQAQRLEVQSHCKESADDTMSALPHGHRQDQTDYILQPSVILD